MSVVGGPNIVTQNLVTYLNAKDNESYSLGDYWLDLLKVDDAILVNSPIFSDGAFTFNGNNNYAEFTNPLSIWNQSFTISQWFYFFDDSRGILLGDFNIPESINTSFEKHTNGRLRLYWNASPDIFTGNNVCATNVWQNVVLVRDKTNSRVLFYVNGNLVYTYNGDLSDKVATIPHRIGSDGRTGTTVVNGRCSVTKIYNKSLSSVEVLQNFNALRGMFSL